MLPEWTWPYFQENYTGPYLSDGKFQASVANGKAKPKSKLDALSRKHDHAYAVAGTEYEKRMADAEYYNETRNMSWFPRLAGTIVRYGNQPSLLVTDAWGQMGGMHSQPWGGLGNLRGARPQQSRLQRAAHTVDYEPENRSVPARTTTAPTSTQPNPTSPTPYQGFDSYGGTTAFLYHPRNGRTQMFPYQTKRSRRRRN